MTDQITWKNNWFSGNCILYIGDTQVGELRRKTWSESATAELNGKQFIFRTRGFFNPETMVLEADNKTILGKITYNSWRSKALISLGELRYQWKYDNAWNTKWSIAAPGIKPIGYQGSSIRGRITFTGENEILILSGLYITNYYRQAMIAALVAIFIPILVAITH